MLNIEKEYNSRDSLNICSVDQLVPEGHLVRKLDKAIDFESFRSLLSPYYDESKGRPSIDPLVILKICFIQEIFGIPSMRQTIREIEVNMAYRWFLGSGIHDNIPHFATISYAILNRFPPDLFEEIFSIILEQALNKGYIDSKYIFIDSTHIKANANKKKYRKELAQTMTKHYESKLLEEINEYRLSESKKPFKKKENNEQKLRTVSTSDPESGYFVKGDHQPVFAYSSHVCCDKNNFILSCEVTSGNVHDSVVFDDVYNNIREDIKEDIEIIAVDSAYKTPWICKSMAEQGKKIASPYVAPKTKKGNYKSYEYQYDENREIIICPNNKELKLTTISRDGYKTFKAQEKDCAECPVKTQCTSSKSKTISKHIWHKYVDEANKYRYTEEFKKVYPLRARTIERVFADAKQKHSMRFTFLKGLKRVKASILLKLASMNLKKMAIWAYNS